MSIRLPNTLDPHQHIQSLYKERVTNSLWCKSQADVANFADGCLYGRFLNELLQNTDDSQGRELVFSMEGEELVITHDGRHFNQTDVEKIISFSNQDFRDKSLNAQMTGYKGIGFKALLSLTARAHIISGGYSFRFDKAYWKEHSHKMPWQMIPIWTELDGKKRSGPQKVTFIFHLTQPASIAKEFDLFLKEPRSTLFLRHIRKITFEYKQKKAVVERKDSGPDRALVSPSHTSSWFVISKKISVPQELHVAIQDINSTICPDRLKQAEEIEVSFAFILVNGKLSLPLQSRELELFNTLPTRMKVGLPFAVNAEFLLEAQREHLVRSEWNAYLFKMIAFLHFSLLSEFAKGKHWETILNILAPMTLPGTDREFSEAYSGGFKLGYKRIAWIPSYSDPSHLLKLEECYVDETGFYQAFKEELPPELIPSSLVHPNLKNIGKLNGLMKKIVPSHVLGESYIINQLESIFQRHADPKLCFKILMFLKQREPRIYSWNQLKEKDFIPTEKGKLKRLSQICLPQEGPWIPPPDFIEVSVMHPAIFELDTNGILKDWLIKKRVSDLSTKNILKKYIRPCCEVGKVSKKQSIEIIKYLFALFSEGLINHSDLKELQSIPLVAQDGTLRPARETYLSKTYQAEQKSTLEEILPNHSHLFVHSLYKNEQEESIQWREFFLELGVTEKLNFYMMGNSSVQELFEKSIDQLEKYLNYLHSYPKPIIGRSYMMDDQYRNVIFFPMMTTIKDPLFAKFFWERLSSCGSRFIEKDKKCEFIDRKNIPRNLIAYEKVSYTRFILRETPCILGTDGNFHKAQDLYSPAFRSLSSPGIIAADIESPLSSELIQYLGFKSRINPHDCYELLQKMRKEGLRNLELYKTLLQELILGWRLIDQKARKELLEKEWFFLAHNNEWVNVRSLSCFAVEGSSPSLQSNRYLKAVSEDVEKLAALFDRPIIKDWVLIKNIHRASFDQTTRNNLIQRLPLIAWFFSHHNMQPPELVLKDLAARMRKLQIFKAEYIPTCDEGATDLATDQSDIYYTDKCHKYTLFEAIAKALNFPSEIIKELNEIYSLKDERSTRKRKTIEDWIKEKGVSIDELEGLNRCIESLDLSPIKASAEGEVAKTTESFESLPTTIVEMEEPISSSEEEDISFSQVPEKTHETLPQPSSSSSSIENIASRFAHLDINQNASSKDLPENEAFKAEWSPTIPIDEIRLSKRGIQKLKSKKRAPQPSNSKLNSQKNAKNSMKPSHQGQGSPALGKWGEAFALSELLSHYEKKYNSKFQQSFEGSYQMTQKGVIEIGLRWLNQAEESCQPYDLLLTKKKINGEAVTYPIEVKATKGDGIHFFMSDGEWKAMKTNPKYRIYMVLHAGSSDAEIYKISNPRTWVKGEEVRIKKRYEVSSSKF